MQEQAAAHKFSESVTELALKQGFPHYVALGTIQQGWVRLDQGDIEAGIAMMRQGISAYRATGAKLVLTSILPLVAGAYGRIGQPEEGLAILEEAVAEMQDGGELWFEASVYAVKGELLLQSDGRKTNEAHEAHEANVPSHLQAEAEACFQQAIAIAQRQGAKSLELRATLSLCRLWQRHGKSAQARQHLARVYDWFSEGFETADLREARAVLAELK